MAATSANPNAAWFVRELTSASVFEPSQLAPYLSEFKAAHRGGDATVLADFLVHSGLLTRYQADRCLAGAAKRIVLGPYFLAEPVGSGSIGEVYQAIGRSDRKRYAVKVLPLRSLWNVRQAKEQLKVFAGLPPHPAIVPFVDVDSAGGSHYLVWPFVEGQSLAVRVRDKGPATIPSALQVMIQAAEGLAVCHAHGIAHGLINPSNLMIGVDGQIRILDLGVGAILSENIADDESMLDTMSAANATMGMIDCCAPETLNSPTLRDPAGDIYSFGCTFHFLLTGRLPFPDGNVVDKVLAHQTAPPPSVRRWNPNVPGWLDDLIQRLMAKAPSRRPSSMSEVYSKLLAGVSEEYVELPEPEVVDLPATEFPTDHEKNPENLSKTSVLSIAAHEIQPVETPTPGPLTSPKPIAWSGCELPASRSRSNAPPSVSEIDFSDYTPPDDSANLEPPNREPSRESNREWTASRLVERSAKPPLVPLVIPNQELEAVETLPEAPLITKRSVAALPAPVTYTEPTDSELLATTKPTVEQPAAVAATVRTILVVSTQVVVWFLASQCLGYCSTQRVRSATDFARSKHPFAGLCPFARHV